MELRVGIVRDDRYFVHQTGVTHPERAARLKAVYRMLDKDFADGLIAIEPEPATLEQLELVHSPAYIRKLLRTPEREITHLAQDTPAGTQTYVAAWLAVGGCIRAFHALLSRRCDACVCLIRPPGHHATRKGAGGFCIFNNLGITATYAIERHGLQRILIIDWDIHHGNGLQELFYDRKEVFYLSTHYKGWYPYSGDWDEVGKGEGLGYTVNVPISKDVSDEELTSLYRKLLGPILRNYNPEMIMIAAGFDAHWRDPLGRTQVTENAFGVLTEMILELRDDVRRPPILMALEGGYDPAALAASVRQVLSALTFTGRKKPVHTPSNPRAVELAEKTVWIHKNFRVWTE
jgi:acetoin utilization deacetylase AcuC-like enzyme